MHKNSLFAQVLFAFRRNCYLLNLQNKGEKEMNNFRIEIITILMIRNSRKVLLVFATLWSRRKRKKQRGCAKTEFGATSRKNVLNNASRTEAKLSRIAQYTHYIYALRFSLRRCVVFEHQRFALFLHEDGLCGGNLTTQNGA